MFKFPYLVLSFILCAVAASADPSKYEQTILADNPVAWWRFDEAKKGPGKVAVGMKGEASGEFRGGVTTVDGLPGSGALQFEMGLAEKD